MKRITTDDLVEHVGCRHHVELAVKDAIREFFTSPPVATFTLAQNAQVLNQLIAHLQVRVPTVTWNRQLLLRAMRAFIEDEE